MYNDPGEFDTGVIGKITATGLVCEDGDDECSGSHPCTVRIWFKIKLTFSSSRVRVRIAKIMLDHMSASV